MRFAGWFTRAWLLALVLLSASSQAQPPALSPDQALARFKTAPGFEVRLFASEPEVRQPVCMTFDARGRMWVIQYLQYPTPAGLTPVQVDRYLRTKYDRMPEPPPKGPRGADKVTILEDTDGDGRVDRTKDFVTGLNLASALAIGNDGVYVGQAPYLLFYPDRNHDDVPDGDPEVLLTGFGLEDAHAVVNSLQFGPDGWLYGAQGSTVTADIRGVGFQQGIWRYHPATKRFELFSEGGGNTWGLDFDPTGQVLAGTNYSNCVGLHQVQGAYYIKGFTKHGPLHNPYSYGYFEHMKHTGQSGGHVTCGGIVYQGDAWPAAFRNTYVGPNLLSNTVYGSTIEPRGSTFETRYTGTLLETDDIWFRPIDSLSGPDGNVYIADWYDKRANHVIPEDTWDRTNGRIWKLVYRGTPEAPAPVLADAKTRRIDLTKQPSHELIKLLAHENVWHRREARRIVSERRDANVLPKLRELVNSSGERLALEALWTWYSAGGWSDDAALKLLEHPRPAIREWTVRWIGDDSNAPRADLVQHMVELAKSEPAVSVRSQLACTAKRLRGADCLAIVAELLRRNEDAGDPHLPLLLWWAIEDKAVSDSQDLLQRLADPQVWRLPLMRDTVVERLARRYLAERNDAGYSACAQLLTLAPDDATRRRLALAMDQDLSGPPLADLPPPLDQLVTQIWKLAESDPQITRFAIRMGNQPAYESALRQIADASIPPSARTTLISAVGQTARPEVIEPLLKLLAAQPREDAIALAALAALEHSTDASLGQRVLAGYAGYSPAVRARAVAFAVRRPEWARALVEAVEAKQIEPAAVSVDQLRQILALNDTSLAPLVEARWGKIRAATPGEKMSYVPVIGRMLGEGPGNFERGHELFTKHCGVCHSLHGEGQKYGPDLTAADRKNRDSLLLNILDPSGTIRPEYVSQTAVLVDGRVITGLVIESTAQQITIVDAKSQKTTLARGEIDELKPSEASLMPERLLETLDPQQIRDLFRYLQSDAKK